MRVHILGGGIGGMSCALHLGRLVEDQVLPRDLEVHVYERSDRLGGKAESQFTSRDGKGAWPGEHGFRFFPNFYRCIVDTLRHIPITQAHVDKRHLAPGLAGKTVFDLLKPVSRAGIAVDGNVLEVPRAQSLDAIGITVAKLLAVFDVSIRDIEVFSLHLTRFLLTCQDRALATWENKTLQDFVSENNFGPGMRTFLRSLRALSAMRADRASLRTLLFMSMQLLADFDPEFHLTDALLPGPTDYLMLEPWAAELDRLGIIKHFGHTVTSLAFVNRGLGLPARLGRVGLSDGEEIVMSDGDVAVLAVPYEVAWPLLNDAPNLPSTLAGIRDVQQFTSNLGLGAEPMVGIQYWLNRDVPISGGHVIYPKTDWAMTSVSQGQFWRDTFTKPLETAFDAPTLKGVLSVIVSGWDVKSSKTHRAPAECDRDELAREAFDQIAAETGNQVSWDDVIDFHVDDSVEFNGHASFSRTPLWVSPRGSYLKRPQPDPHCGNFFIASDWARTETDVGSMESADEAARWTVRAIGHLMPSPPPEEAMPQIRPLRLWRAVEVARTVDKWLFDHDIPTPVDLSDEIRASLTTLLRGIRDGAPAPRVDEHLLALHGALGHTEAVAHPQPLTGVARKGAGRVEVDRLIRVLEATGDNPPVEHDAPLDQGGRSISTDELLRSLSELT